MAETYFDPNEKVREKEMMKSFKDAMDQALTGGPGQCQVESCLGTELRSGLGFCKTHWGEKLKKEESEREKKYKEDRKQQAKIDKSPKLREELSTRQRLQVWFNTHRHCAFCGRYCDHGEGSARIKKHNPKTAGWPEIGPNDHAYETVCSKCESKF